MNGPATAAMHAAPNEVHVRRLQLRGTASQVAQARSGLAAELSHAAWPIVGDDEVLLLRRVRVRAPLGTLALEAAAATRALAARAVDPWSPAAAHADALRFASRADYVAWRLHGQLMQAGPPAADRVAAALCDAPAALPAVWRRLRDAGGAPLLQRLWAALDAPAAAQVLAAAAAATGWLPALRAPRAAQDHDAQDERHAVGTLPPAARLHGLIGRPGQPPQDARTRLAALLALWMHVPARLQSAEAPNAMQAAAWRLAAGGPERPAEPASDAPGGVRPGVRPSAPAAMPAARPVGEAGTPASGRADVAGLARMGAAPDRPGTVAPAVSTPPATSADAASTPSSPVAASAAVAALPASMPHTFVTRHGGLFWLIQALALPPMQRRLATLDEPQAGWREWVRLAHALGAVPDDAWNAFAAARCQLDSDDPAAVHRLRWPADEAQALQEAVHQRFGLAALEAARAERPARVVADEVRVEVHFRLADADIDVRRAGLDGDPGWVPWLGCVLRWHFGSALAPNGEGMR